MDFPSSLHDQQIKSKKKPLFRIGFLFLFAASLGLNFYLLFFDGKNQVEIAKLISPKEESTNLLQSSANWSATRKNISLEKIVPESPKIQQVLVEKIVSESPKIKKISFSSSAGIRIGDLATKSLEFKVRNSKLYCL